EVTYRALYRSHAEEIKGGDGTKVLQNLIAEYNMLPGEKKVDFADPLHRDYLRDKIKRVVKEKASMLCVYEEGRDHHGGVRPDHVFLAAIDENFQNSNIEDALRGSDIDKLKWVTSSWHNEKEIIFYRAVLNVPLYVFGRMQEMRTDYHEFKDQENQPKTLHIDRNWEDSLDDLDPTTAKEIHRRKTVTSHIVNFACLLRARHPNLLGHRCILKRDGQYFLVDPDVMDPAEIRSAHDKALSLLGSTMTRAIENLPQVMREERVKFAMYQFMLHAIRDGLSPKLLAEIARLPFLWRRQREELKSQYAPHPDPEQRERLEDFESSYLRLQEALASLLKGLRNQEAESRISQDSSSSAASSGDSSAASRRQSVRQSIEILDSFDEEWRRLLDPERPGRVPDEFQEFFEPLEPEKFSRALEKITNLSRRGETGARRGEEPEGKPGEGGAEEPTEEKPEENGEKPRQDS
ncbi:MAG: hypothetical protein AAF725_24475, partial [Acidobacteriota bacterium]